MSVHWNTIKKNHWDRAVRPASAAMQQDWSYGAACEALGSQVLRAEIFDNGHRVGLAQLIHRRLFGVLHAAVCTRGPVWTEPVGPPQRQALLRELRRSIPLPRMRGVFITPDAGGDEAAVMQAGGHDMVMTPYSTAVIDLTSDIKTLRDAMHGKWRNRLVHAENADLTVSRIDRRAEQYLWLLEHETAQQRAKRYSALPPALVQAWHQAGGDILALRADRKGEPLAAMLFLLHGTSATYHIGWSSEGGRKCSAHNLLLWTAICKLRRKNVRTLDLGGLNTEDAAGIARFKLGAGGRLRTLCGTWFGR